MGNPVLSRSFVTQVFDISDFTHRLPHRFSFQFDLVAVVQQTIENGVSQGRIANGLVPLVDRQLAGNQGGAQTMTILHDFQ